MSYSPGSLWPRPSQKTCVPFYSNNVALHVEGEAGFIDVREALPSKTVADPS